MLSSFILLGLANLATAQLVVPLHTEKKSSLHRRGISPVDVVYADAGYLATLQVGNTTLHLTIDTGSAYTWSVSTNVLPIRGTNYTKETATTAKCEDTGCIPSGNITEFIDSNDTFSVFRFGDMSEIVTVNTEMDLSVANATFLGMVGLGVYNYVPEGVAVNNGIMGLSPPQALPTYENYDALLNNTNVTQFTPVTVLEALQSNGVIPSRAFSIHFSNEGTGSVYFGAIDTQKYTGNLTAIKMPDTVSQDDGTTAPASFYWLTITGSQTTNSTGTFKTNVSENIILDTGTTISKLPVDIVQSIADTYGGELVDDSSALAGFVALDCADTNNTFSIELSGVSIDINLRSLVFLERQGVCFLALGTGPLENIYIIGSWMMRSIYSVFDLDNWYVAIAQSQDSQSSSLIPISNGTIPNAIYSDFASSPGQEDPGYKFYKNVTFANFTTLQQVIDADTASSASITTVTYVLFLSAAINVILNAF